jgi:predicted anti-sigma-YlaC factor YlaD
MDCSYFKKLLSREMDGELNAPEREALERHLSKCDGCRLFRAELGELFSLHRGMTDQEPPVHMLESILLSVRSAGRKSRFTSRIRIAVSAAAAVIILIGVGAGKYLSETFIGTARSDETEVLELEQFGEYPPGSIGDLLASAAEEVENE